MSRDRGPGAWRVVRAARSAARASGIGVSVLLACSCGAGSPAGVQSRGESSGAGLEAEAPALVTVHRELDAVRLALDRGAPVQAGRLLFTTLRSLESAMASENTPIDTEAAVAFEDIRRASDRWQAGAAPSRAEARRVLERLDLEASRLISFRMRPSGPGRR
jgi:hypothetical protein